jgi:hypothetical protein
MEGAFFAFQDEIRLGNLTKVEAEMGGENWEVRKPKCFTLVFRFGAVADRLEPHLQCHTERCAGPSEPGGR